MALRTHVWNIIHNWEGNLHTGQPQGWVEGTKLGAMSAEPLMFQPVLRSAEAIRRLAHESNWRIEEARAVAEEFAVMLSSGVPVGFVSDITPVARETYRRLYERKLLDVSLKAVLLDDYGQSDDGTLVRAIEAPWLEILELLERDPEALLRFEPRDLEKFIAACYDRAGFDEVILTPRSGDHGRDVIATKKGVFSVRIIDQVKAQKDGRAVDANDVRALLGSLQLPNVSKAVFTTTSSFSPRLLLDPVIGPNVPHRLELRPRDILLPWIQTLRVKGKP